MKTNKSFLKRLKITRKGKILARKAGQDHFRAKESRRGQLRKNRSNDFSMNNKTKSRYLVNS